MHRRWGLHLTGLDFRGNTVRVNSAHESSRLASILSDMKKMCKGINVNTKDFVNKGSQTKNSKQKVAVNR